MRIVTVFLLLIFSALSHSQGNTDKLKRIVEFAEVGIGETFAFNDYEVKLIDVIVDSRCPKDVICVRAGEAVLELEIYQPEEDLVSKQLTLYSVTDSGNIFSSELLKISGLELLPYPKASITTKKEDYQLKILIETFEK